EMRSATCSPKGWTIVRRWPDSISNAMWPPGSIVVRGTRMMVVSLFGEQAAFRLGQQEYADDAEEINEGKRRRGDTVSAEESDQQRRDERSHHCEKARYVEDKADGGRTDRRREQLGGMD